MREADDETLAPCGAERAHGHVDLDGGGAPIGGSIGERPLGQRMDRMGETSPRRGHPGEEVGAGLVADLDHSGQSIGDEDSDAGALPLEKRVRPAGRREAHLDRRKGPVEGRARREMHGEARRVDRTGAGDEPKAIPRSDAQAAVEMVLKPETPFGGTIGEIERDRTCACRRDETPAREAHAVERDVAEQPDPKSGGVRAGRHREERPVRWDLHADQPTLRIHGDEVGEGAAGVFSSVARTAMLGGVALGLAVLPGCDDAVPPAPAAETAPVETAPAEIAGTPPVTLGPLHQVTVTDLDGKPVSLATLAGRPMIIEVWATWCGPCVQNRQLVHSLKDQFPSRLAVVGVSVDEGAPGGGANAAGETVRRFLKSRPANEFEFPATPDFHAFVRRINPSGLIPKTIYVDSRGRVADLSEGVQTRQWLLAMAKNLK